MNKERARAYARELYYWRKEHGICTVCGKRDAVKGRVRCTECAERENARLKKRYQNFTPQERDGYSKHSCANAKRLREKRKSEGLCPLCGKPAQKNKVSCTECLLKDSERQRELRKKRGVKNETSL